MPARPKGNFPPARSNLDSYFVLLAGIFLILALVKWARPVILDSNESPKDLIEFIYSAWPIPWGYWLGLPVALLGWAVALKHRSTDFASAAGPGLKTIRWLCLLPFVWLLWQGLSAIQTLDKTLTLVVLKHFAVCTLFFYLGYFGLRNPRNMRLLWVCLTLGLVFELRAGLEQHFGGLEEQRRYFLSASSQLPPEIANKPELLKKLASDRIYGTFIGYPNSLAGSILLLLPISIGFLWTSTLRLPRAIRAGIVLVTAMVGAACLYWSGSKAGWLFALAMGILALLHTSIAVKWRRWLVCGIVILGLVGFGLRYAGYFKRGATSVAARFDYWRAATMIAAKNPILGSGLGSFEDEYRKIKPAEAEYTRLVHNDYLQQASDSGIPSLLAFAAFVAGSLIVLYRKATRPFDLMYFTVWLGLLGISLHSLVDFHLYVPPLAWTVFFLLGWAINPTVESRPAC